MTLKEIGKGGIEDKLNTAVRATGRGTTRKWVSPGRKGVPDRIVIWFARRGRKKALIHFVETKAPKKGPRTDQGREHERMRKMGCDVFVINSEEQIAEYVKEKW